MLLEAGYREGEDRVLELSHKALAVSSCGHYRLKSLPRLRTCRPRGREDWQLIYLAEGKMTYRKNGVIQQGEAPFLLIYRPGEEQDYGYELKEKPDVYWIHFDGSEAEKRLQCLGLLQADIHALSEAKPVFSFLMNRMVSELQLKRSFFEESADALLAQLLCEFARTLSQEGEKNLSKATESALKYFHRHYASPLSLKDYAHSIGMTHSGFCHLFSREVGRSPTAYLQALRLNAAKELLSSTEFTVTQIADQVGYEDPLYFSRLFRRLEGKSPSEYRKGRKS